MATPVPDTSPFAELAHGIGSQHDLPLSPFYAYAGAFAALLVSFLALGLLWSTSRFRGDRSGLALPRPFQRAADARATRLALRVLGLAAALFVLAHLLFGPDDAERNPAPGAVHVLFWVGLVPASLLFGPVWRLLNPLRTLHAAGCRALKRNPAAGRPLPQRLGMWPAAAGLFAYTWLELASPDPASRIALLVFLLTYAAVHLAAAARFGARWFAQGDAFEAYSTLFARLSPLGRRRDGRLVLRNPFHGLDATPPVPGLVATVCVMLGSTAYDGYSDSPSWITTLQTSSLGRTPTATLGLLGAVVLVAALYSLCALATRAFTTRSTPAPAVAPTVTSRTTPTKPTSTPTKPTSTATEPTPTKPPAPQAAFAHSLIPIALGYLIAHYFTLFVTEGPRTVIVASGTDNPVPPEPLLGPGGTAALQVVAIIAGHVLGVVAAHDRAVRLLPPEKAIVGQLPLFALMIAYTLGGLGLLIA
ncbi:hypothetical protein H9Y04_22800 [Streptomyces sp. TRM66268-LWL]|uniref:Uncharacterized protein n=1 Tax=Streptomyces polyasparticus TaxID=2767826 RepID=A0ABR7SK35_9ACTN|nr:hypothetical protein [Streptomyces polyasparticus]MBC9715382.1 hypothetical protein [Streptomyces polyasparticus]